MTETALTTHQDNKPAAITVHVTEPRRELVPYLPTPEELTILETMGKYASDSRLVASFGGLHGIMLAILYGRELGIAPMTAVNKGFHAVLGRLQMSAYMMHLRLTQSIHEFELKALDYDKCTVWGKRGDSGKEWEETYTIEDARRAKLVKADSNWEKTPKDMLFAAAVRVLCRRLFPEIIGPGMAVGETEDQFDDKGNLVPAPADAAKAVTKQRGRPRKQQTVLAPEGQEETPQQGDTEQPPVDAEYSEVPSTETETTEETATEGEPATEDSQDEPTQKADPGVVEFVQSLVSYLTDSCQIRNEGLHYTYQLINDKFQVNGANSVPGERLPELMEYCRGQLLRELEMENWIPRSVE